MRKYAQVRIYSSKVQKDSYWGRGHPFPILDFRNNFLNVYIAQAAWHDKSFPLLPHRAEWAYRKAAHQFLPIGLSPHLQKKGCVDAFGEEPIKEKRVVYPDIGNRVSKFLHLSAHLVAFQCLIRSLGDCRTWSIFTGYIQLIKAQFRMEASTVLHSTPAQLGTVTTEGYKIDVSCLLH